MQRQLSLFLMFFLMIGNVLLSAENTAAATTNPSSQQSTDQQSTEDAQIATWKTDAAKAAQDYVNLMDQGQYAQTWANASYIFQRTIGQAEWAKALELTRQRLGKVTSRALKDEKIAFDPKGLPKGVYMVVEYNTSFQAAPNSGELLTLMLEPNGTWKVLTYQVD